MLPANVAGQDCWILNFFPAGGVRLFARLEVDEQRGLTGRSSREPQALTLKHTLEWSAQLPAAAFAALRNASRTAQDEPFLAPVWPHAIRVGIDTATLDAGLVIAWKEDWSDWAINPGSLAAYDYAAPLLFGRLTQPPRLAARSDELVIAEFSVEEDAPVACAFTPAAGVLPADTTFNTAGGFAAPVFPFVPDWGTPPVPGIAVTDVERVPTGPGRQKATAFYPQLPEQIQQATFKFPTVEGAAQLLEWWKRRAATAGPHWIATTQKLGFLAADADAADTVLDFLAPIAPLGSIGYVALSDPAGRIEIARVTGSDADSVTLAAGLAHDWPRAWTVVAPAILARHTQTELQIDYAPADRGWSARATLGWREVAPEYAPPAGETRGTTLGRLPGTAWFFQIDLDYHGALQTWRLTNFESGAEDVDGHDWVFNACDFDLLVQDIDPEDDSCTFIARWFADGPWDNWLPGRLAARGFLTIYRADVSSAGVFSNFEQVLKGEMDAPDEDGPFMRTKVEGANALFAQAGMGKTMGPRCRTNLFSVNCGLDIADWTFNAVVTVVAGNVVTIGTITRAIGGGLPAGFGAEDWFALGWLAKSVAGTPRRIGVLSSTAIAGGLIELTLEPGTPLVVADAVTLVPGCDLLADTCRDKFDNYDNFRGFENIPAVAPAFILPQQKPNAAKK